MKMYFILLVLLTYSAAIPAQQKKDISLFNKALELAQKYIIIDTHIDLPSELKNNFSDITKETESGCFDFVRAKEGGLNVPFMSIYTSANLVKKGESKKAADRLIDIVEEMRNRWPDKFAIAVSTKDIKQQFEKGLISMPMGMENGSPIEDNLDNLKYFYNRGIRYITLCHSKDNLICDSSYDTDRTWRGLSPFGEKVISEMNGLGIMIDISHVSDDTFYDVLKLTKAPVIASHSSCRNFTPGFERNMSDEMIKALANNGGVIQITFGTEFLSNEFRTKIRPAKNYLKSNKLNEWSGKGKTYLDNYINENNIQIASAKDIAVHIDHVVKLVGINHVGIGSDFEGVNYLPVNVNDVSCYPNVIYELLKLGYTDDDIQKICSGNILRVWEQVENISQLN
ncbi:MAG: dipeptidase [Bacteroidetes bacterium]|nr:dipeptidase [Bacteroidota bacterium]